MEDSFLDDSPLDESIDSWLQDIRDRQLEAEANRKSYFTRENEGNFNDSEIRRNFGHLSEKAETKDSIRKAAANIIHRIQHLGLEGIEKLVRNG